MRPLTAVALPRLDGSRFWLAALVFLSCVAEVYAKASAADGPDSPRARALHWGAAAAGGALLVQLLMGEGTEDDEATQNTDAALIWREDEGASKLVPSLSAKVAGGEGAPKAKLLPSFTVAEVAKHCTREDLWIIVEGFCYDVSRYVDRHPGGWLPLVNLAGKDCTDAFANYHGAKVYRNQLPAFLVGRVTDLVVPPHVADFRAVRQELLRRGLFQTRWQFYAKMGTWYAVLFVSSLYLTLGCASLASHMGGALLMGLFWQQLAGLGHDLGHSGVTHRFDRDYFFGVSVGNALMGVSTGWWKRSHNTHHVVCNSIEHDPDIQHLPIFAVAPNLFEYPFTSSYHGKIFGMGAIERFLVSNQHYLFYPIMMLARFNLYVQGWILILSPSGSELKYRKTEAFSLVIFAVWVISLALSLPTWPETVAWVLVSHAVTALLHVQITISHWAMHTYHGHGYNDASDEWYITQFRTTMNVDTPPLLDWLHIGLQFQIEHHLYPRLPRHNLRKARELVRAVCAKHDIHYHEPSFFGAQVETIACLRAAAAAARAASRHPKHGFYSSRLWEGMNAIG